jgi:predicted kinase
MSAKIIIFSGPPCSGKTTLAEKYAKRAGLTYLQMDEIRQRLFPESDNRFEHRQASYSQMHIRAEQILQKGLPVILDATYGRKEQRLSIEQITHETKAKVFLIECHVTPREAKKRFKSRTPTHPALDLTEQRVYHLAIDYPYYPDCESCLKLQTTGQKLDDRYFSRFLKEIHQHVTTGKSIDLEKWIS